MRIFLIQLLTKAKKDNLLSIANELTYKILLSMFPFIIFLVSILAYLNLDGNAILVFAEENLPSVIVDLVKVFVDEVVEKRNPTVLSSSLIVAVWSITSGFSAVIRGINKTYGEKEKRGYFLVRILSVGLMIIFTLSVIIAVVMLVFRDHIIELLFEKGISSELLGNLSSLTTYILVIMLLFFAVLIIYKISGVGKRKLSSLVPGALVTVFFWGAVSKIFSLYVNNFSRYSRVYGSLGSVFALMIWLNLMTFFLLFGSEINALLLKVKIKKTYGEQIKKI